MRRASALMGLAGCVLLVGCAQVPAGVAPVGSGGWQRLPAAPLSARQGMVAEQVDGRFLLIGGSSEPSCPPSASCVPQEVPSLRDGAVLDPDSGRWRRIADAPLPVSARATAVVGDSLYLIDAPDETSRRQVFLRYDLGSDVWTRLPDVPERTGDLVAAGGVVLAIADTDELGPTEDAAFDPGTGRWDVLPTDPLGPSFNRSAAWLGDRLLLTCQELVESPGADGPSVVRMAVLDAELDTWTLLPDSPVLAGNPIAVGDLVVFPGIGEADGGEIGNWGRSYAFGGIWEPAGGRWSPLPAGGPSTGASAQDLPALGVVDDREVVIGDAVLDPVARSWRRLPASPLGERYSQAVVVGDGSVLIWGGTAPGWRRNLDDGAVLRE